MPVQAVPKWSRDNSWVWWLACCPCSGGVVWICWLVALATVHSIQAARAGLVLSAGISTAVADGEPFSSHFKTGIIAGIVTFCSGWATFTPAGLKKVVIFNFWLDVWFLPALVLELPIFGFLIGGLGGGSFLG